ncbi:MAG: diacylglycerol/polyprenol kinase family protein [Thermoplasmatota archaeon]
MLSGDLLGVIAVYAYVAVLLFVSEKVLRRYPLGSRKFLHIMVGNVLFILPLFEQAWVMSLVAAAPFILLTFLVSPYSPLKIVSSTSAAGHGLGLVYYAISWTVLAWFFFDRLEVIAVGIVAMSYGDGLASLVGIKFGRRRYNICGDIKSVVGSLTMLLATMGVAAIALAYYHWFHGAALPPWYVLPAVAAVATLAEGITPRGLDNLATSFSAALLYIALG